MKSFRSRETECLIATPRSALPHLSPSVRTGPLTATRPQFSCSAIDTFIFRAPIPSANHGSERPQPDKSPSHCLPAPRIFRHSTTTARLRIVSLSCAWTFRKLTLRGCKPCKAGLRITPTRTRVPNTKHRAYVTSQTQLQAKADCNFTLLFYLLPFGSTGF